MLDSFVALLRRLFATPSAGANLGTAPDATLPSTAQPDLAQVRSLIGKVTAATSAVAQDVGDHNANIQAISAELTAVAQSDPSALASIVCRLLVANQGLQGRLQRAETMLKDHSNRLDAAITSARTDSLTGLMNRRALDEELNRCLADHKQHGRTAALFMLDVDKFKEFNDTFGHMAGDQALVHVAQLLRQQARTTDLMARFGGEEFAIVFTATTAAAVRERAERFRHAIGQQPLVFEGHEMSVTASAGLAELINSDTVADWVSRADRALYAAKGDGRNCAFEAIADSLQRIPTTDEYQPASPQSPKNEPVVRSMVEAAPELAAEAFADTSFVPNIARRIAEWRRGGATLTVVLARLDTLPLSAMEMESDDSRSPIRVALELARHCLREMDSITRWQSDGLALLMPNTPTADAKIVGRRLRAALAANSSGRQPRLSISIGIAEGIEGNDAKRVLERAWLALEAARSTGSGNIFVHDGIKAVGVRVAASVR